MTVVALVAVYLAAARESPPAAGIAVVVACTSYLGYKRYSATVTQRQAIGSTASRAQIAGLLVASATFSALVIGLSVIAFLIGYYGYLKVAHETIVVSHWTPYRDPGHNAIGVTIGATLALFVASSLRRTIDREELWYSRRWLNLWPVGLVVFLGTVWGAQEMRERYSFCRMMAEYHAGPEASADGVNKAALHAWLKRWYQRAAFRPWLPIHPVRIPPGLE